ncbi:MAG: sensor histidine kinase KdpD [Acidobacteriia bacterium]|nr:sensor histidine kinase KdpD [Terriglobia bacterium]
MPAPPRRRSPEELLKQVQAEEAHEKRGRLKVFLGYASGVGKSFRMLDEGRRRRERGESVVVGAIQPKTPPEIEALLAKLEVIPVIMAGDVPVMDVAAILKRHPGVCLVDGLAYDNPPGFANPSRWQDVQQLLEAGISVVTSVNIQYIDELADRVARITGKQVTQTVPRTFLNSADEMVVVDAPPEMLITRTAEGEPEAGASSQAQKLSELREIALLLAADVVDQQLEQYLQRHQITQTFGAQERILVCITPRANASMMISSGKRNADRFHGDLTVAYVGQPELSADDQAALDRNLAIARDAAAHIQLLEGEDPISTLLQFAREHGITQIFVGHSTRERWWERFTGTPLDRLIHGANDIDVRVFPH